MKSKGRRKKRNVSKILWMGILLVSIFYVANTLYQQQKEMKYLVEKESSIVEEIEKIQEEIDFLNQQLEDSNDDEYIEKIARQQLKMIGSDEVLVIDMGQD